MLSRILFLAAGLVSATGVAAQEAKKPVVKTTQNQYTPDIDYKVPGAPMPRLKVLVYNDTAKVNGVSEEDKARGKRKKKAKTVAAPPALKDTTYLTEKDFDNGYNLFIMLFNPTCGHCQDMGKLMENNIALFKKSKILLLATPVMTPYMSEFTGLLHTAQYPSIRIGMDSSGFIDNTFLYRALPQINIYDGERKLLKIYTGDVHFDSLKQYIQ
jgi:hypothetical protein